MAKKKGKKGPQKQVEAPASPKPEPTPLAEESIPEPLALSSEAQATDSTPDEPSQSPEAQVDEAANGPTSEPATQDTDVVEPPSSEDQGLVNGSSPKEEDPAEPITSTDLKSTSDEDGKDATDDAPALVESNQDQSTELEPEATAETQLDADVKVEPTEQTIADPPAELAEPAESTEPVEAPAEAPVDVTAGESEESHVELPSAPEVPEAAEAAEAPVVPEIPEASEVPSTSEPEPEPTPVPAEQDVEEAKAKDSSNDVADTETTPLPAEPEQPTVSDPTPQVSAERQPEAPVEPVAEISAEQQNVEETAIEAPSEPEPAPETLETAVPATPTPAVEREAIPEQAIEQEPQIATEPETKLEPVLAPARALTPPLPEPEREPAAADAAASLSEAKPDTCQQPLATSQQRPQSPRSVARLAAQRLAPFQAVPAPPKHEAIRQVVEDNRPPAPSPPAGKVRPRQRHAPAFDDDDEDSDSALIQTRRPTRGGEALVSSRDSSGSRYPPQSAPAHSRPAFASRVPMEHYPNPPPPPPPGYHPGYGYPPAAPPYYHPHHGYGVSQQGYSNPSPYGPRPHAPPSPYQDPWNQYPPGYPPHGSPHQRHDSSGSRDHPSGVASIENGSPIDGETADVFSRLQHISQAIPDLHVLLARYKETHGQLSVREDLLRRSAVEQEKKLSAKDDEIHDLNEKISSLESRHSAEGSRLRFEIRTLEEQVKELREQVFKADKAKREAEANKASLEVAMKSWEAKYKELEQTHAALERAAAEEREQAWRDFDEWKSTATTRHDAEKIALAIQFDKKLKEADVLADSQRQEASAAFDEEKEELRAEYQRQQQEREDQARAEFETKLSAALNDREEALRQERESRELWLAERDNLQKGWDEQRSLLEAQHMKDKEESDKAWLDLQADANRQAEEHKARAEELLREREDLLKQYDALKVESQKEKEIIKSVATNLDSEKARLERMMECYGDIAEIKSKGDAYYLVSFSQLQKQIIDLASTHFVHLPVRPPAEELAHVPHNLPSFLGDTTASRQVRAAYIAHTVSKLITYRVFGPFLFSLGRRYDKADGLFLSMSNHIRDKSTRKEAIWRQQTLLAAFTSSGAKQRINTAAGTVVEEIVNAIKHFADPKEEECIKIAVKRIVKLAAETWRFARLEREMITATMPALQDEEHQFTGPEYWRAHDYAYSPEGSPIGTPTGATPPFDAQPRLLLRLFPVIYREAKHENFHSNDEQNDQGCIYHHGMALYDHAESVVTRAEELKSAGLPSFTTASPTRAEFGKYPPPMVPPPRNPLPPTPAMSEKTASVRTRSRPSTPIDGDGSATPVRKRTPPPTPSSIAALNEPMPSMRPVRAYTRPPPGPIDFATPRNIIGMPLPVESIFGPQSSHHNSPSRAPGPVFVDPTHRYSAPVEEHPAPVEEAIEPLTTPAQEPDSPPPFPERDPPTPPYSRSSTPPRPASPLFEATDEIESLQQHRPPPALLRRRSTRTRRSDDEMPDVDPRPETTRRTSGYALSHRSTKTDRSDRTDRTDKTDLKTRYMHESRSAAIKGLYPNYPMPHGGAKGTKDSVRGGEAYKKKDKEREREKERKESDRAERESLELRRERSNSVADNGTWDTNSTLSSLETNTQFSVN